MKAIAIALLIACATTSASAQAYTSYTSRQSFVCDKYIATTGSAGGDGSIGNPWDMKTGFAAGSLAGKTVCMRGGTYTDKFFSLHNNGSVGNEITFRSYPGEWAVLDGYVHTTLNGAINNSTTTIVLGTLTGTAWASNITIVIDDELIDLGTKSGSTFTGCTRATRGTTAVSHSNGADVILKGETFQWDITSSYIIWRDFEVTNSWPRRDFPGLNVNNDNVGMRGEGLNFYPAHSKAINLVMHDNQDGIGFWENAIDSDIYGCVMFNNGMVDSIRGHGHGIYTQNTDASGKRIKDVISLNNYATGMKMYGNGAGQTKNYTVTGVISFNNGSPAGYSGNPAGLTTHDREAAIFAGTEVAPMDAITVQNSYTFDPADSVGGGANAGYISGPNTNGVWQDNYFLNGIRGFGFADWTNITFQRNVVYSKNTGSWNSDSLVTIARAGDPIANYSLNHNTYFDATAVIVGCPNGPDGRYPFADDGTFGDCNAATHDRTSYAKWLTIGSGGWEASSTYTVGAPTSNVLVVRANTYDTNLANALAMVWDGSTSVSFNVSAIWNNGDTVAVYAAENLLGTAVATPTISGGVISVPVNGTTVAMPTGSPGGFTPATVRPTFAAFRIVRTAQGATSQSALSGTVKLSGAAKVN